MQDRETTVRSRELGEGLRRAMERARLSGKDVAEMLGWSESRVSRMVRGKRGGSPVEVASVLALCRVTGEERDRLLRMSEEVDRSGWLQQSGGKPSKGLHTLVSHEDKAIKIVDFQLALVPGLLQTVSYAHAVIGAGANVPPMEHGDRVQLRMSRQAILRRANVSFSFVIPESVLNLPVGGPTVMSAQLHHLLQMSVRPNVSLRVLPVRAGAHAGMGGSFRVMEFEEYNPIVYLEHDVTCVYLEHPGEIEAYRRVLRDLCAVSLDERQSREMIAKIATEVHGDGASHYDRVGLAEEQF